MSYDHDLYPGYQLAMERDQARNTLRALLDAIEQTMRPCPGGPIEQAADEARALLDGASAPDDTETPDARARVAAVRKLCESYRDEGVVDVATVLDALGDPRSPS